MEKILVMCNSATLLTYSRTGPRGKFLGMAQLPSGDHDGSRDPSGLYVEGDARRTSAGRRFASISCLTGKPRRSEYSRNERGNWFFLRSMSLLGFRDYSAADIAQKCFPRFWCHHSCNPNCAFVRLEIARNGADGATNSPMFVWMAAAPIRGLPHLKKLWTRWKMEFGVRTEDWQDIV
jgi:hypothetical protein